MRQARTFMAMFVLVTGALAAADAEWLVHPSSDKGIAKEPYAPAFEKHFKFESGVLRATSGLGETFFKSMENSSIFTGTGPLWVTRSEWPRDAANFELVVDYKWFQEEPMTKFGDFPDMHIGFRLDKDGAGYDLQWGMLGQIRLSRRDKTGGALVAHGTLPGMKGKWARVKIRAAGPMLKVKIWNAEGAEPATWSAEGFDDWAAEKTPAFQRGAIALGFYPRLLFDTCVYEYRDSKLTQLTAEETAAEKSFDPKTAPAYIGLANNSDTTPIKSADPAVLVKSAKDLGEIVKDANVKLAEADGAVTLTSEDGKPAFVWKKTTAKFRFLSARLKSASGAFPLFAVKAKHADGKEALACLDPGWREGLVALWNGSPAHTAAAYRWTWKPDTWHDFVVENAHWQKWQILDTSDPKNRSAFAAALIDQTGETWIGVGVEGKGAVTIQGLTEK